MTDDANVPATPPEQVEVTNLDHFVRLLVAWHSKEVHRAQQLLQVPVGTAFTIGEEELVLEGPALAGFKFGVEMTLMCLGSLPFVAQVEEKAEEPPAETKPH